VSEIYQESQRSLQDAFDSRRLADRIEETLRETTLGAEAIELIRSVPFFFISTIDARGFPTCSYKGGAPGFVRVLDPSTIVFPSYNGNGMFLTTGNILASPKVGLLFIDFEDPDRLRVHGEASVIAPPAEDPLLQAYPGAELIVRVKVLEVFPNCPRYIHRCQRKSLSEFVPAPDGTAPVPEWKKMEWAKDVLPGKNRPTGRRP
jgi:uncharacterized protein